MFQMFARSLSVLLIVLLASCAATTPFGEVPSIEAERAIGDRQAPAFILSRGGLLRNEKLTRYLNEITAKLTATTEVPEGYKPLRVKILDSSDPGAFAVPGGQIYVTRGMIAFAKDEAQLAGVIAHEIGHVVSRHIAEGLAANEQLILDIIRQEDQALRGTSRSRAISIIEREIEERIGDVTSFSKEQELAADRLGIQMTAAAGYDPSGFAELLERLEVYETQQLRRTGIDNALLEKMGNRSGYPKIGDRVAALGVFPETPVNSVAQDRLMAVIDGIKFDDRYQGGIIRNGVYWHPARRISFDVPSEVLPMHAEDFHMLSQHGLIAVRLERLEDVTFDELFESMKAAGDKFSSLKLTRVNGFPAIVSKLKTKSRREGGFSEAVTFDLDGRVGSFVMLTNPEEEPQIRPIFSRILGSVKLTDFGDAPKQRRYQTRRVKPGDTVASLLADSKFEEGGEADLRLLNSLGATEEPSVGSWIKLVD